MSNIINLPDPIPEDYEHAYRARFNDEPPKVVRRKNGFVIVSDHGTSGVMSRDVMQGIIDHMIHQAKGRRA